MDELKSIISSKVKYLLNLKKLLFFSFKKHFGLLLFIVCCFFPLDLAYQNIKTIKSSLKVEAKRGKPPLIALVDETILPSFEVIELQPHKPFVLAKHSHIKHVPQQRILRIKKPLSITARVLEIKPIRIESIKMKPLKTLHLKGARLSSAESIQLSNIQREESYTTASQGDGNNTSEAIVIGTEKNFEEQTEFVSANEISDFERRWFAYMKEREIEEEKNKEYADIISSLNEQGISLAGIGPMPSQKWVGDIWVSSTDQKPSPKANPIIISSHANNNTADKFNVSRETLSPREVHFEPANIIGTSSMTSSALDTSNRDLQEKLITLPPTKVLGNITLLNGLGLLEGDQLNIAYANSCSVEYDADVDLKNGRFNIDIGNPSFGVLKAQLRGENGLLRGSGEIALRDFFQARLLEDPHFSSDTVEMDLQVTPFDHSPIMQIFDIANKESLRDALVEIEGVGELTSSSPQNGLFSIPEMLAGSSFITKVHTKGLWKTLFLSTNDVSHSREIPTTTLLTSLQRHVPNLDLDLSVIWGRVLRNGKPLEGVSLELAESYSKPYYLTVDHQFVEGGQTTSTGYFAYANVPPGLQILKVKDHNEKTIISPRVLWTDRGYVSSVQLEDALKREVQGCIFDSQTGSLLSGRVNYLGSDIEEEIDTQSGFLDLDFFNSVDPLYFELRPNEHGYYPMTLMSHRNRSSISFPVSSRAWINEIIAKYKINRHPDLAMVIGHVSHSSFRAYIENVNDDTEIVYFDSYTRETSQEPLLDLERGGFILFNVEPGLRSVHLSPSHSQQSVAIKTVIADSDFVSVFSHDF